MKCERTKGFISGILVSSLIFALIGTATAAIGRQTLTADYADIKIELDGEQLTPTDANGNTVEPFAVSGTTYLPVRAVANMFDCDVEWDGTDNTIRLWSGFNRADAAEAMSYYKALEEGFAYMQDNFESIFEGTCTASLLSDTAHSGPHAGRSFYEALEQELFINKEMVERHYAKCKEVSDLTEEDISVFYEYRRLNSLLLTQLKAVMDSGLGGDMARDGAGQPMVDCLGYANYAKSQFWAWYLALSDSPIPYPWGNERGTWSGLD